MKVPPKRKGNDKRKLGAGRIIRTLNESPSEKEGKFGSEGAMCQSCAPLNESPSEKEGKLNQSRRRRCCTGPLNESPSEKEGKSRPLRAWTGS